MTEHSVQVITEGCPVCGSSSPSRMLPYNGYDMSRCAECSLVYTSRRDIPTSQYEHVYTSHGAYRSMIQVAERTATRGLRYSDLAWYKRLALRRMRRATAGRRLLDVGCGPGTFLLVAKRLGWDTMGLEPATPAARQAASYGLDIYNGVPEDFAPEGGQRFDVVTSFEVLEHVPYPLDVLRAMHRVMHPGSVLIMSVPNLDDPFCLRQKIPSGMPPVHINFFNRRSLRVALHSSEFAVSRFTSLPIPTSSVRNVHGKTGLLIRLPLLALLALLGRADGTTLLAMARRS